MKIIKEQISLSELEEMAKNMFGNLVKAVVDVEKKIMAVDAPMHSDEENELIQNGSSQQDLWGINLRPKFYGTDDFVEFDSMINLRPGQGNRSRSIDNPKICDKIIEIVNKLVVK
jgi:hypothetical protein